MLGTAKVQRLMHQQYDVCRDALKALLGTCRKVTICLDGWTTKGLTFSYLGISASFFDPTSSSPKHYLLSLCELPHPHTASVVSSVLDNCLGEWGIPAEKVLVIVSDNGANMVKAIRLLQEREKKKNEQSEEVVEAEQNDDEAADGEREEEMEMDDNEEEDGACLALPDTVLYRRMACLAHTLQLVIKTVQKGQYAHVISKARRIVGHIRKSSVMAEKLVSRCGKNVVSDCVTRWNSTHMMTQRLLEMKADVNSVLGETGIDTLLASEWAKLEEMANLLAPFSCQTDTLQTNCLSLSLVLPSLMDLECHLQQHQSTTASANVLMLADLRTRFSPFLNSQSANFNPVPAAACLLDHTVAPVLLTSDNLQLIEAAKLYLISEVSYCGSYILLICL